MGLNTAGIVPPLGSGGGGGGSEDLNQVLINGPASAGEDIILSDGAIVDSTQYSDSIKSEDETAGIFFEVYGTGSGVYVVAANNKNIEFTNGLKSFKLSPTELLTTAFLWANSGGKILGGLEITAGLLITTGGITQIVASDNQLKGKLILGASGTTQGEIEMYNNTDGSFVLLKSSSKKLKINNTANDVAIGINTDPVAGIDLSIAGITNFAANDKLKIANVQLIEEVAETIYSGTVTWDGAAPTTLTNATYRWTRVGKMVNLRINLKYTNPGFTNTAVTLTLPSGAPTPQDPSGFNAANDYGYIGSGSLGTGPGNMGGGNTRASLGPNATATGYILTVLAATALSAKVVRISIDYYIA